MKRSYIDVMKEAMKQCDIKGVDPVLLAERICEEEKEKKRISDRNERLIGIEKNIRAFLKNRPDLKR